VWPGRLVFLVDQSGWDDTGTVPRPRSPIVRRAAEAPAVRRSPACRASPEARRSPRARHFERVARLTGSTPSIHDVAPGWRPLTASDRSVRFEPTPAPRPSGRGAGVGGSRRGFSGSARPMDRTDTQRPRGCLMAGSAVRSPGRLRLSSWGRCRRRRPEVLEEAAVSPTTSMAPRPPFRGPGGYRWRIR
jgi:hypothetical protein